ncbi:MAG: hypothetical protein KTR30_26115, partial [Saprospiraceae bacterium]|nr:hypothetical protein [Saprospiraceae bacterium]
MRKYFSLLVGCLILFPILSQAQTVNNQGMKTFWQSMKKLERRGSLSEQEWQNIWNAPGFNKWMSGERSQSIFKNYYTLVYNPAFKDSLQRKLANSEGYVKVLYQHQVEAKQKRKLVKRFIRKFKRSDIVKQAKEIVKPYLPEDFTVENEPTDIAFLLFQPDGFAVDDTIIIDALFAYNYGDGFEKFVAHELHHVYVANYISKLRKVNQDDPHFQLIQAFKFLRMEGTADLIDKVDLLERTNKNDYETKYAAHYRKSKTYLHTIDSLLQEIANDQHLLPTASKEIRRQLPYNGHPMGLYIAHLIEKKYGRDGILKCLDNPFTFIKLYNTIAKDSNGQQFVFSEKSMQYLA